MSIDKTQLISLLAEKTGLDEQQTAEQLDNLIEQIQAAADRGEDFEIEGFGTFSRTEGELQFEPAPTLETEINHKYIGMKPIELIGAFKEEGADVPLPDVQETKKDKPDPTEQRKQEEKQQEPSPAEPGQEPDEEIEVPGLEQEMVPVESPAPPEAESVEQKSLKEKAETDPQPANEQKEREEKNPIDRFLIAAVILIVVGAGGWMLADFGVFDNVTGSNNNNSQTEVVNEENSDVADRASENEDQETSEQNDDDAVSTSEEEVAESSRDDIYGLRGGATPEAEEAYTIVIFSLADESRIRDLEEEYESDGYITLVRQATVGGDTYWRLGLGQFQSVEEAQQAAEELPEQHRNKHFIRKFQ